MLSCLVIAQFKGGLIMPRGRVRQFSDEERVLRRREALVRYRQKNTDKIRATARDCAKRWREKHPARSVEVKRQWRERNSEDAVMQVSAWRRRNPDAVKRLAMSQYRTIKESTPSWLTVEQKDYFKFMRLKARDATMRTGVLHVVDHVIPLRGKNVRGLHVPWNLQILTMRDNSRKSNKVG